MCSQYAHLNLEVTGADGQVIALFGPGDRGHVVLLPLHLHQQGDLASSGVPQVDVVVKRHSEKVPAAPVEQVQICWWWDQE